MKIDLKGAFTSFKRFLMQWNEFITVPLAFVLFWLGGSVLRWIDPTSALFDAGIFQIIIFAIAAFLLLHGVAWLVLKITFPTAYHFFDDLFEHAITSAERYADPDNQNALTQYQKCVLVLLYLFGCLFSMVLLARVIM